MNIYQIIANNFDLVTQNASLLYRLNLEQNREERFIYLACFFASVIILIILFLFVIPAISNVITKRQRLFNYGYNLGVDGDILPFDGSLKDMIKKEKGWTAGLEFRKLKKTREDLYAAKLKAANNSNPQEGQLALIDQDNENN